MKRIDLFCASQASTAVRSAMDQNPMVHHEAGRAIDRTAPHLIDSRRSQVPDHNPFPAPFPKPYRQKGRKSSSKLQAHLSSPLGSSRYLLGDSPLFSVTPDHDPQPALPPIHVAAPTSLEDDDSDVFERLNEKKHDQVVELRVSLHCKGCEGKVRKHISKMKGVTSFSIDFSTKKVTLIGNLTPVEALASVSKVKNAEFWSSS